MIGDYKLTKHCFQTYRHAEGVSFEKKGRQRVLDLILTDLLDRMLNMFCLLTTRGRVLKYYVWCGRHCGQSNNTLLVKYGIVQIVLRCTLNFSSLLLRFSLSLLIFLSSRFPIFKIYSLTERWRIFISSRPFSSGTVFYNSRRERKSASIVIQFIT